jgi:predicted GTPase
VTRLVLRAVATRAEDQLRQARELLALVREALAEFDATDSDRAALAASILQLEELFLLVIVGEFNAGKSAFINALIGQRVLPEGVTPTTDRINVLQYGDTVGAHTDRRGLHVVTAPIPLLRDLHIVDTPGTNAIQREHERLTTDFVPRSDLVLFLTSADRPFTESVDPGMGQEDRVRGQQGGYLRDECRAGRSARVCPRQRADAARGSR